MRQNILAGIDVGSSKIATLIADVSNQEEGIKIIGVSSTPSRGIRKGQIVNIEEASEAVIASVESAERMAGYSVGKALTSINGSHIASQNSKGIVAVAEPEGEIVKSDVERVLEAARAISLPSSREIIHVIPRDFTVDGQEGIKDPVGMSGVRLEVDTHIVSGSSTAMRNLARCVSEVGADVQDLVTAGLASSEAVLTDTEKELGVILLDIGGGTTNIVVFVEGSPLYQAVLPIGAKNVTNDLAIGLRLSLESAEKIKIALSEKNLWGKDENEEKEKEKKDAKKSENEDEIDLSKLGISEEVGTVSRKTLIEGIIKPRLNEIFTMVGMEIKKSGAGGLTPSGVVICGGGAQTVGVLETAKRILAMPTRIGIPQRITGLIDDVQTPEFATAVGLLLYGAKESNRLGLSFSLGQMGKKIPKIPFGGVASRLVDFFKSFLP